MYFHDRRLKTLLYGLLFYLTLIRAQETLPQTIFSLDIFSSQKPCAQACFTTGPIGGCFADVVGDALGCVNDDSCGLGSRGLAPNDCYCRTDLQSVAESFITSCVKNACTVGDSLIDISSAGSIYDYYCSSQGFPVNGAATTTEESSQATTTVASSSPHDTSLPANSGGVSSPDTAGTSSMSTNSGSATTTGVSNSPSQEGGGGGYSTSDKIALGTGIGIGLPGALAAIIAVWIMRRRRRDD